MTKICDNALRIRTTGNFHKQLDDKKKTHLTKNVKQCKNNNCVPLSQDYTLNISRENITKVNYHHESIKGKPLSLKTVVYTIVVISAVSGMVGASPIERSTDMARNRHRRGIGWFTAPVDCDDFARARAKVQELKECSDDVTWLYNKAKHLTHHVKRRGKDECNNINNEIKEMKIVTGKPITTSVSSDCLGENVTNDIANLKREKRSNDDFIQIVEQQHTAYSEISSRILRMHGNNVNNDIKKLEEQQAKIVDINHKINTLPADCLSFVKNQQRADDARGAYKNLDSLTSTYKDSNFEINRDIIFANDAIPKRHDMSCETDPIAQQKMDAYHDEKYFRCDNGAPPDKYCQQPATHLADEIYMDNFRTSQARAPLYFK